MKIHHSHASSLDAARGINHLYGEVKCGMVKEPNSA